MLVPHLCEPLGLEQRTTPAVLHGFSTGTGILVLNMTLGRVSCRISPFGGELKDFGGGGGSLGVGGSG